MPIISALVIGADPMREVDQLWAGYTRQRYLSPPENPTTSCGTPVPVPSEQLQNDDHQDDHYQHADDRANQSPIHAHSSL